MLDCAPCDRRRAPPSAASSARLLAWYAEHGRDLPWRRTRHPYRVLVSEIMLQQTQVDRVMPKYRAVPPTLPALRALARAPVDDVRQLWYPLGYNVRPLRLHAIARESVARYGGRLPDDAERAPRAARRRTLHGRRGPLVRLRPRRRGARHQRAPGARPASSWGHGGRRGCAETETLWELAERLVPAGRGYDFNQALMDFGATWCTPRRPRCEPCPMRRFCATGRRPSVTLTPLVVEVAAGARPGRARSLSHHAAAPRLTPGRTVGVSRRQASRPARLPPPACAASSPRSSRRRFTVGELVETVRWEYPDRTVVLHFFECRLESGDDRPARATGHGVGRARPPGRLRLSAGRPRAHPAARPAGIVGGHVRR